MARRRNGVIYKFECSLCRHTFKTEEGGAAHLRDFHPKKTGEIKERRPREAPELREWEYQHLARGWPI